MSKQPCCTAMNYVRHHDALQQVLQVPQTLLTVAYGAADPIAAARLINCAADIDFDDSRSVSSTVFES